MKKIIINIQVAVCILITSILMLVLPLSSASWKAGGKTESVKNSGLKIMGELLNKSVFGQDGSKTVFFRIAVLIFVILTLIMLIVHLITAVISIFARQKRLAGILFSAIPLGTFLLGFILYILQASSCLKKILGQGAEGVHAGVGIGFIICLIFMILILVEEIFLVGRLTADASGKRRRDREPVDYGYPGSGRDGYGEESYPAYGEPSYSEPAYREPAYDNPAYKEPAYGEGAYREPAYGEGAYGDSYGASYSDKAYREPGPAAPDYPREARADYESGYTETAIVHPGRSDASMGEQSLRCLSGEYEGAVLPLKFRETMYIGRDHNICNVILNNPRVSRKHCSVQYDVSTDTFKVVNYSKNGVFVEGQRLETNRPYQFPHGTILKISDADLFQLL